MARSGFGETAIDGYLTLSTEHEANVRAVAVPLYLAGPHATVSPFVSWLCPLDPDLYIILGGIIDHRSPFLKRVYIVEHACECLSSLNL